MTEERAVFDPFDNKTVQVSDRLTDRLRGRYACGPTMANGEPEFGWNEFPAPPIQIEAAEKIERLRADLEQSYEAIWQALDDMSAGLSVCEQTKEMLRAALRAEKSKEG